MFQTNRKFILVVVGAASALVAGLLLGTSSKPDSIYKPVTVQRGDIVDNLMASGVITTGDPVLIRTNIKGKIDWIIEEGSWVEAGDRLYQLNIDEAMRSTAAARTSLLTTRNELALARMRQRHAKRMEQQKVKTAERTLQLERVRYRILSTAPVGGNRLIDIHAQLVPLEAESGRMREAYEKTQDVYRKTQERYVESLDQLQEHTDTILRVAAKVEEYIIRAETRIDETKPDQVQEQKDVQQQLAEARAQLTQLREQLPEREGAHRQQRLKRDDAKKPRDELFALLQDKEQQLKELYIALEIEKRGLELARLQSSRKSALLALEEATHKHRSSAAALERGAMAQSRVSLLASAVDAAAKQLNVIDQQIKLASRPVADEVLTEARLKLEQAENGLVAAKAAQERSLKVLEHEVTLLEAQSARAKAEVDRSAKFLPKIVTFKIRMLRNELDLTAGNDGEQRQSIEAELDELESQLEQLRTNPPHIGRAPRSGVVRLTKRWGRPWKVGDDLRNDFMVIMHVEPPTDLEVRATINETDVHHLRSQMPVRIVVPVLDDRRLSGQIAQIGAIGKDKYDEFTHSENPVFAGVTEFEARIRIDATGVELRPGMMVLLEIEVAKLQNVLHLPRAAVIGVGERFVVLGGSGDRARRHEVDGRFFADDVFIVDGGLREGDVVYIKQKQS